jgi:hypothetical protein
MDEAALQAAVATRRGLVRQGLKTNDRRSGREVVEF